MHTLIIFAITITSSALFAAEPQQPKLPPRLGATPKAQSDSELFSKKSEKSATTSLLPTQSSDGEIPVVTTRTRSKVSLKRRPKAFSSEDLAAKIHAITRQRSPSTKRSSPEKNNKRKNNKPSSQAASVIIQNHSPNPKLGHTRKRSSCPSHITATAVPSKPGLTKMKSYSEATIDRLEEKHVQFGPSHTRVFSKPQAQAVQQVHPPLDPTLFLKVMEIVAEYNRKEIVALIEQRVSLNQRDYTYESHRAWRKRGFVAKQVFVDFECVQLLIAKNDKEEAVDWYMRPHIALLHTHEEMFPFDMSTPPTRIKHNNTWILLENVFENSIPFPKRSSYLIRPYETEMRWNEYKQAYTIIVLKRYLVSKDFRNLIEAQEKRKFTPKQQDLSDEIDALSQELLES